MFKLKQDIVLLFLFVCLLSCSSNPKSFIDPKKNVFISKPEVTFNIKTLPKQINVFYFNSSTDNQNISLFMQGITDNYYYYKKSIGYAPELNFIDLSNNIDCIKNINLSRDAFSVGFFLNRGSSQLDSNCYQGFQDTKGLVVSNTKIIGLNNERFRTFNFNRKLDIKNLLSIAKSDGNLRAVIIDDPSTKDKELFEEIWRNMDGEVISSVRSENELGSQKLLSEILLLGQSKTRSRKLSRIIGLEINNKLRRREDIDSIFLSTSLANARSLKPALEYNFADNLSVYLIPSWEEEGHLRNKELDLENVIITEMPFLLNTNITFQKTVQVDRSRNYAIGYDTFELVLLLNSTSKSNFNYFGLTGLITNEYPLIQKKSLSAKVIKGELKYLNYAD
tara:strand:- start:739 stop:1914 length:1176 start_codon:yes stop_codon:yes gene_type:complete